MISDGALAQLKHDSLCDAIASHWVRLRSDASLPIKLPKFLPNPSDLCGTG